MRVLLLSPLLLSLVACATMTTGTHEEIKVTTSPTDAHAALVCEGKPIGEGSTPQTFTIRRNAGDCQLTLHKEGFEDRTVAIEQGVNPAYWGNMLLSPVVPGGVYDGARRQRRESARHRSPRRGIRDLQHRLLDRRRARTQAVERRCRAEAEV